MSLSHEVVDPAPLFNKSGAGSYNLNSICKMLPVVFPTGTVHLSHIRAQGLEIIFQIISTFFCLREEPSTWFFNLISCAVQCEMGSKHILRKNSQKFVFSTQIDRL